MADDLQSCPDARRMGRALLGALAAAVIAMPAAAQVSRGDCGGLANGSNGPFDYRSMRRDQLANVENFHFTPEVEALLRGKSSTQIGADINYVLLVFPNHPRALLAMMRLGEKQKTSQPPGAAYPVECYFERALRFQPEDNVARMAYAMFLIRSTRAPEALRELDRVVGKAGDNAFTHFNAGLLYFEMKEYDKALVQAHRAQALGMPRTDLRDQLKSVGKWAEPVADAAPAASAPSAASAAMPAAPAASAGAQ
ncbi:MAG TPA: ABC transporter permease [Burkholderiaceae bacterium]|nr:ABC transporter permease [Burkholderiaceae bacterium]